MKCSAPNQSFTATSAAERAKFSIKSSSDVGFYYAANAGGRLIGILLSGALTQAAGLAGCLWGSTVMLALCLAITFMLPTAATARRVPA
jgi:hypothetical protein